MSQFPLYFVIHSSCIHLLCPQQSHTFPTPSLRPPSCLCCTSTTPLRLKARPLPSSPPALPPTNLPTLHTSHLHHTSALATHVPTLLLLVSITLLLLLQTSPHSIRLISITLLLSLHTSPHSYCLSPPPSALASAQAALLPPPAPPPPPPPSNAPLPHSASPAQCARSTH